MADSFTTMNDLPKNELLSAYLDDELTAAERAEVERLLAASPAARQLLDELRALSTTLQSLPRQKLKDDLSRQVVAIAEQRRLAEGGPDEAVSDAPVPLHRSVFRRFVNRRTLFWVGLTTVIAIMIRLNEPRQGVQPGVEVAREMTVAPAKLEKRVNEPWTPPSIRAAHDARDEHVAAKKPAPVGRNATPLPVSGKPGAAAMSSAAAPAEQPPAVVHEAVVKSESAAATDNAGVVLKKDGDLRRTAKAKAISPAGAAQGLDAKAGGPSNRTEEKGQSDRAGQPMLVVHCDITPEAAEKHAFDKLLDANGIAQRESLDRKKANAERGVRRVVVEATGAQLEAVLAGLAAQPKMFLAVSFTPAKNAEAETANDNRSLLEAAPSAAPPTALEFQQRTQVSGSETSRGAVGQLDVTVRHRAPAYSGPEKSQYGAPAHGAEERLHERLQTESPATSLPQRMVFELRVVEGQPAAKGP